MPRIIEFKTPATERKTGAYVENISRGYVARLYVGNYQEKFILQFGPDGQPETVAHFASGYKLPGSINDQKVRYMLAVGSGAKLTDRKAAQAVIDELVRQHSAGTVLEKMRAAPVINK
jgi:hypothetical protein